MPYLRSQRKVGSGSCHQEENDPGDYPRIGGKEVAKEPIEPERDLSMREEMELLKRCLKYVIITRHEIIDIGMENYYRTDELLNDLRKAVGCTCSNPLWHDAGCQIDREIDSSETE